MTQRNWSWEAKNLLPHLVDMLGNGITVQAGGGGGGLVAHALNSTTWHTGTLNESQAPWAVPYAVYDPHVANVNAHHNKAHTLATHLALGGDHSISGAQAGWVLRASAADAAAFAQLQHDDLGNVTSDQHHVMQHEITDAAHHTVVGAQYTLVGVPTTDNVLGMLTPTADASASGGLTAILRSSTGSVGLLGITSVANITMGPLTAVLPTGSILKDLGDYNRKWRSLYAAELYVETLVAQDVLATIGGRIMVAPTTKLIADLAAGGTTIDVEHNNLTSAFVYMASAPGGMAQVEVMKCGATATPISGGYRYTVTRNLDGSGANAWVAGDAIANIGAVAGQGFIELTSTNTALNHLGPTIAIYARTGTAAWTDVKPVVALGNLRSFVDYADDQYGFALGNDLALTPATGFSGMTGDRTNGLRLFNTDIELYTAGARFAWATPTEGFGLKVGSAAEDVRSYTFSDAAGLFGWLQAWSSANSRAVHLYTYANSATAYSDIAMRSLNYGTKGATALIDVNSLGNVSSITMSAHKDNLAKGLLTLRADNLLFAMDGGTDIMTFTGAVQINGTLGLAQGLSGTTASFSSTLSAAGISGTTGTFSSTVSTTFLNSSGSVYANSGMVIVSNYSPGYGVSINANTAGGWARGYGFRDDSNVLTGQFGAFGSNSNVLSFMYIGLYGDYVATFTPSTKVIQGYGNWGTTGYINAGGEFKRDGVAGAIYVPVTPFTMTDTNGSGWGGASRVAGTYYFDVQANGNNLPAGVKAICIFLQGNWAAASNANYAYMEGEQQVLVGVIRAHTTYTQETQGIVAVKSDGWFHVVVGGATMSGGLVRCVGYFL